MNSLRIRDRHGRRRTAGRQRKARAPEGGPPAGSRFPERPLLWVVRAGLAVVLLTPLVVSPWAFYSFPVGKAVYARTAIAVVFALWAVLALARPRWRPPVGAILVTIAAALLIGGVSAWLGVSPQRSLWSTYTRMGGLVDSAHWFAFLVVLVAVARRSEDWLWLLNVHLAVGLCVGAFACFRLHVPEAADALWGVESRHPRVRGTVGNPTFLGAYLQGVALLAAGFLVRSFVAAPAEAAAGVAGGRGPGRSRALKRAPWAGRAFWILAACSALLGLGASGSLGALAGIGAGAVVAAALYAWLGGSAGARRTGRMTLGAVAAAALGLVVVMALRTDGALERGSERVFDSVLLERATSTERIGKALGKRFANWEAGLRGFVERPLFGWGPENYYVAAQRHLARPNKRTRVYDHAHNLIIEEAATRGLAGLAVYLALWGFTFRVVVRAARGACARDRALVVFAGAALAGWFVQSQSLFYSPSIWLQHMLLLGFVASLEPALRVDRAAPHAWLARALAPLRHRAARVGLGAVAMLIAAGSIASSLAIHAGGAAIRRAELTGPFLAEMERAIGEFEPLANGPRIILFNNVAANWTVLATHHRDEAERLLAWMDREAPVALAAEPESWVLHHALARLYRTVAVTHPEYTEPARRHLERSLELAPNLDPLEAPRPGDANR